MNRPIDWRQCRAVESVAGQVGGAWVFNETWMPVATVLANFDAGLTEEEIMEQLAVTQEQMNAVLHFAV